LTFIREAIRNQNDNSMNKLDFQINDIKNKINNWMIFAQIFLDSKTDLTMR
jgi:hypothetical protein